MSGRHKWKNIKRKKSIRLSREYAKIFIDALENPPEPNDRLKKAAEEYKRRTK